MREARDATATTGFHLALWAAAGIALILGLAWLGAAVPVPKASEITVNAGVGQTAAAEAVVADMFSPGGYLSEALISSSSMHVATTLVGGTTINVYTYNSIFEDRGALRCVVSTHMTVDSSGGGGGGAGGGCPSDGQSSPAVGGSVSATSTGGKQPKFHLHTATVTWGHDDATSALTETARGQRIKSNVVDGNTIAVWRGSFADQLETITLFDVDENVLWTKVSDPSPPVPGLADAAREVQAVLDG